MRNGFTKSFLLTAAGLLLVSGSLWAHHGEGNSYDTAHMWTTWATVEEFDYINPHPAMKFSRTDKSGNVEHWAAEVDNNPGSRVKLSIATAKVGGHLSYVRLIQIEKGEFICSEREEALPAVDLDGVPDGYQPDKPQESAKAGQ